MRSGRARLAAEQAHRRGDLDSAHGHYRRAIELPRSVNARPLLARALLERGRGREDAEACAVSSELGARGWSGSTREAKSRPKPRPIRRRRPT